MRMKSGRVVGRVVRRVVARVVARIAIRILTSRYIKGGRSGGYTVGKRGNGRRKRVKRWNSVRRLHGNGQKVVRGAARRGSRKRSIRATG